MGQPTVSSVTWRNRIKRIFQGFYETVGQQIRLATKAKTALALNHGKKSKSGFTCPCKICRGVESFSSLFPACGMAVNNFDGSSGLIAAGSTAYYFALFYHPSSASGGYPVNGYAFQDSNWAFSGVYATNSTSDGLIYCTSPDTGGFAVIQGLTDGQAANYVVIGWSANIGATLSDLEAWYAAPTFSGWIGQSNVSGPITVADVPGLPQVIFGTVAPYIPGFSLDTNPVPEPSTLALIGLSGLGLGIIRCCK